MGSINNADASKLISDRGPAQPSGFADEGKKGSNDINDQHPATPESMAKQDALKDAKSTSSADVDHKAQP
jgi:hypothetical protein